MSCFVDAKEGDCFQRVRGEGYFPAVSTGFDEGLVPTDANRRHHKKRVGLKPRRVNSRGFEGIMAQ